MRKLLLASAAMAAGSLGLAGTANAQFANVNQTPIANQAGAFGTATPSNAAGPGSITVRLNGRLAVDVGVVADSGRNSASGNTKQDPYAIGSYARLFPGFDGIAGNGMRYGASLEIRQDNGVAPGGGAFGSISGSNRTRAALYWRREMAYLGFDGIGTIRFGAADGPIGLFYTGAFENFNTGGWNGDLPGFFTGGNGGAAPNYPFPGQGALYTTEKVMYLSPQFFGVDFGVAFEPGTGAVNQTNGNCSINTAASSTGAVANFVAGGATGCDAASATGLFGESARRHNTIDAQIRYRGAFGPIGLAVTGGYMTGGHVLYNGAASGIPASGQFKGIGMYDGGLQVTYGGLAVGGHITGGANNSGFGLLREGQKHSFAWLAGASYAFGQFIVGASYYQFQYAGLQTKANNAFVGANNDVGIAAGGTWTFAPGMNIFLDYLYGTRSAANVNLLTGTAGTTVATGTGGQRLNNHTQAQGIMIGTAFRW